MFPFDTLSVRKIPHASYRIMEVGNGVFGGVPLSGAEFLQLSWEAYEKYRFQGINSEILNQRVWNAVSESEFLLNSHGIPMQVFISYILRF